MPDTWTAGVDRATGYVITSSNWNELLGADGSLNFLGTTHDHSGDAGDGVQFDFQSTSAGTAVAWSPPDEVWTDVDTLPLTLTVASTCQLIYIASAFYTSDGNTAWRIRRTSGGGASLTQEYLRPGSGDGLITLAGRSGALAAGAHTISLQVYEHLGVEVTITFRDAVLFAMTEIS